MKMQPIILQIERAEWSELSIKAFTGMYWVYWTQLLEDIICMEDGSPIDHRRLREQLCRGAKVVALGSVSETNRDFIKAKLSHFTVTIHKEALEVPEDIVVP